MPAFYLSHHSDWYTVGTPDLAHQYRMEVLRSRISGWVDSTTHLGVVSLRKHMPEKAM